MEGMRKNRTILASIAGMAWGMLHMPSLEQINNNPLAGLGQFDHRRGRTSGGNGKPYCAARAKRKRQMRAQAISHQRCLARERSR
jgi:hypothetical protein